MDVLGGTHIYKGGNVAEPRPEHGNYWGIIDQKDWFTNGSLMFPQDPLLPPFLSKD